MSHWEVCAQLCIVEQKSDMNALVCPRMALMPGKCATMHNHAHLKTVPKRVELKDGHQTGGAETSHLKGTGTMDYQKMTEIEPRLKHLEAACLASRQQSASWPGWWATHHVQLTRLVGANAACPELRNDRAWDTAFGHLAGTWVRADIADAAQLPWSERPLGTSEPDRAARVAG
jgi:hypothetical protein